jgi:hypothetical protein
LALATRPRRWPATPVASNWRSSLGFLPAISPRKIHLTKEHIMNYVPLSFREDAMFRAVVEEAAALTSISLFLGMVAIWSQVIAGL